VQLGAASWIQRTGSLVAQERSACDFRNPFDLETMARLAEARATARLGLRGLSARGIVPPGSQ
jgi:hypothetical protein